MSREEIGGTTTPAPEASLAGISPVGTCPASPVGVPGDAGAFSTEKDARLARLRAGHAAHFAWSDDTIAAIKRMAAEAVDVTNIAKRLGLHVKTLRNRAPLLGIDLIGEARRRQARGDEVLRRLYPTDADIDTVHAAWVEAIGEQRSRIAMRSRAVHINLRRDTETPVARMLRANRARQGKAEAARREKAAAIQRDIDAGATRGEILVTHRVARETLRQMTRGGLVTFPPVVAVVKPPKPPRQVVAKVAKVVAPKQPKPPKLALGRILEIRDAERRPTPPRAAFQTVEAYLAAGGKITRCPTVAVLPTQAEIPAEDRAAMAAHHKAADATGKDWKAQRAAMFRRSKAQGAAIAERNAAAEIARRNAHRSVSEAHRATGNLHWREEKMVGWR